MADQARQSSWQLFRTGLMFAGAVSSGLAVLGLLMTTAGYRLGSGRLAPARGTVSYRGRPVRCGHVIFAPDAARGCRGDLAIGELGPDGSFTLRTGAADGAVVGWHRVTIAAVEIPAELSAARDAPDTPLASGRMLVPERYCDPDLSGLSREIKADQENVIRLSLD